MPLIRVILLAVLVLSWYPSANAEEKARRWTSANGKFTVTATLVDADETSVRLRREDGKVIRVPLSKLSTKDREYLTTSRDKPKPPASTDKPSGTAKAATPAKPARPAKPANPGARLDVQGEVAVCVFLGSNRPYKLGQVQGDHVKLYATYGGLVLPQSDLQEAVSMIAAEDAKDTRSEQRALLNALLTMQLPGIWLLESVSFGRNSEQISEDDPNYLIIRADMTFRIVKRGRKPQGTWKLDDKGQFVMTSRGSEPRVASLRRQTGDKIELTMDGGGTTVKTVYGRTDLTREPK